ncbi:MAG: SurA N-terminal domain-containing protein [Desulfamplus sp.]|nr:SurA N-terminal domain-containing protein [Desulfamplus sp.]
MLEIEPFNLMIIRSIILSIKYHSIKRNTMVNMIIKTKNLVLVAITLFSTSLFVIDTSVRAELIDRIIATVNNDIITLVELNNALRPYVEKVDASDYTPQKKRDILTKLTGDMLSRMIERKLTDQEAKRIKITVSDKEVDSAIEGLKQSQLMSQDDLEKALKDDGLTFAEYREKIREEILRPKLINYSIKSKVIITDSDIKAYYENHPDEFAGRQKYYLRNILLASEDSTPDIAKKEQKKLADEIKMRLDAGEDFKTLARSESQAPNASEGGDLGLFERETLSDRIRKAIEPLKAGEHTDVILTDQGYQIFYVQEIQNQTLTSLDEVKESISKKLYDNIVEIKFREWLDALKEKSHIKIML